MKALSSLASAGLLFGCFPFCSLAFLCHFAKTPSLKREHRDFLATLCLSLNYFCLTILSAATFAWRRKPSICFQIKLQKVRTDLNLLCKIKYCKFFHKVIHTPSLKLRSAST